MPNIMNMGKEPDYLGSWDLYDVPNNRIQVTIKRICDKEITGDRGKKSIETVCEFQEHFKPMILNKTNKKRLARLFKSVNSENLVGKRIEICYEQVKTKDGITDALRIVPSLIPQQNQPQQIIYPQCEVCGGDIRPTKSMTAEEVRDYTKAKLGKAMCSACANKAVKAQEEQANAQ